jgi:ribosomal protein S12 methylthiotransferase accessory factor
VEFIPAFARGFTLLVRPAYLVLLSEEENHYLPGSDVAQVASRIDGRKSVQAIARSLGKAVPAGRVRQIVQTLRERGLLVAAAAGIGSGAAYLAEAAGADPAAAKRALTRTVVSIDSEDSGDAEQLATALRGLGARVGRAGAFTAAIASNLLAPRLEGLNARFHAERRPWLLIKPDGGEPSIGPLFVPGRTGCWACLAHRVKENRWLETRIFGPGYSDAPHLAPVRPLGTAALSALLLAANQIVRWIVEPEEHPLAGKIWRLSADEPRASLHLLSRRPDCPVCGGRRPGRTRVRPLTNHAIAFVSGGGYRAAAPDETVARLEPLVSPVTGIVRSLLRHGNGQAIIYGAEHTLPLPVRSIEHRILGRPGIASGKGMTEAEAKAGCLAEAVERYCAVFQGTERRVRARAEDLPEKAAAPPELASYSDAQYAGRSRWNRSHGNFQRVPEPFDPAIAIEWSPATSLVGGATVFLPTAYCYLQYRDPQAGEYCYANSNGCAAGNVREEALLQGLLELIERDAIALWWYNRARRPGVDVESFREPRLNRIADRLRDRGRSLAVLDLTTDLGMPVFAAVSAGNGGRRPLFGFGAHLDARVAMTRALTELAQVLSTAPAAEAPRKVDLSGSVRDYRRWLRAATLENQPYLTPSRITRKAGDWTTAAPDGLLDCLNVLLGRCSRAGLDVLALDLTRADIGFPVVRVVAPGLRQCWAQFGPGRLYTVPPALGWASRAKRESELNPFPFFL